MKVEVASVKDAGMLVRAVRKSQSLRQDELAGSARVGPVFVSDAERGKETIEFGRFLRLLDELGIRMQFDIPESAAPHYQRLKQRELEGKNKSARGFKEAAE